MKKFFLLASLALMPYASMLAENTDLTNYNNVMYAGFDQITVAQYGSTATIEVYANVNAPIMDMSFALQLPEGVTATSWAAAPSIADGFDAGSNLEVSPVLTNLVHKGNDRIPAGQNVHLGTLTVNIAPNVKIEDKEIVFTEEKIQLADAQGNAGEQVIVSDNIVCTLSVRRAAVVTDLAGFTLSIVPKEIRSGLYADGVQTTLDVMYTAATDIANLSFDLELPNENFYSQAYDADSNPVNPETNAEAVNNTSKIITANATDDQHVTVSYEGVKTTREANKRYIKQTNVPTKLATIYIESEDLEDGEYVLKLDNISIEEYITAGTGTLHKGVGYSTVIVGSQDNYTSDDTQPIVYGYITDEAETLIQSKFPNAESIDMSSAIVSNEETIAKSVPGVLVYTPNKTSLSRNAGIGTICVPYELTSDNSVKYYTLSAANENVLTFTEQSTIPANTPALYSAEGEGFTAATDGYMTFETPGTGDEVNNLTFTGTYETKTIQNGYYIANGKFWDANQTQGVTIPAFRAYFEGSAVGIKSFNIALDETTGLRTISAELTNDPNEAIYDLSGRKINRTAKGVNIVNGKKYLVK
ncbi:MAG: hypothetical protein KBT12_03260 [Bacteroidales bacterium]|nr:hypothetical protein [Candidatus Physcousia equi]